MWVLYFLLHSLFARPWMKDWFSRHLRWLMPHYRLFYSLGSSLGLLGILFYNAIISHERLLPEEETYRYVGLILATLSVLAFRQAFRVYSFQEFVGLKPVTEHTADQGGLKTHGILAQVRHPLYLAMLLFILGFWFYMPTLANLITTVVVIIYLFVGIRLEERDLEQQFGDAYRQYRQKVPMIIPKLGKKRRV
ncbi:isoprenylcysteine carboxyl methyltransferase [Flammeovirgaceae bacterium 311]|nr:isoprenylcysteine carboxyl methyltransferase [Flammeovirgaceae bacterium 311]